MLKIDKEDFPNVIHVQDDKINKAARLMRPDLELPTAEFRQQLEIIYQKLLPIYFENLNCGAKDVGLTIILRAAISGLLAMKEKVLKNGMPIYLVWIARDEISIQAQMLRCNLPDQVSFGASALIIDPVCATATSSIMAIQELNQRGFRDITCLFCVASKDGLKMLRDVYPDVKVIVGFTGSNIGLNEKGYVVYLDSGIPVIGDAGDRWMGITSKGKLL